MLRAEGYSVFLSVCSAALIPETVHLDRGVATALFIALVIAGMVVQSYLMKPGDRDPPPLLWTSVDGLREISETIWKKEVDEMKTVMISIVLVCFVFTRPSIAASSTQEDQKKDYQEKIETKLKEFDQKLEELKEKVSKIEKESKEKLNEEIEALRKKQETSNKKLEELKSSGSKTWKKMKRQMDSALDELEKMYDQVKSRFK